MKTIYPLSILLIALLFLSNTLRAGNDDSKVFPSDNAIWSYYLLNHGGTKHYYYGLTGDTIINDLTYSKLYLLNDSTLVIDEEDIYVGGIREKDKIVYFQLAPSEFGKIVDEYILFDFSKTVGETIALGRTSGLPRIDITSKYIETIHRYEKVPIIEDVETEFGRKISIDGEEWIENVGSLNGFFWAIPTFALDGTVVWQGGILGCMKENNEIRYINYEHCERCFGEIINDPNGEGGYSVENQYASFSVSYNPVSNTIEIISNDSPCQFTLYNQTGIMVYQAAVTGANFTITNLDLPSGIYIYSLSGMQTKQTGKILIHHK